MAGSMPLRWGDDVLESGEGAGSGVDRGAKPWFKAEHKRDSSILPSDVRRSSCKPTDHPARYVGIAYAMDARIFDEEALMVRHSGGHAVCDFKDDSRVGGANGALPRLSSAICSKR